MTRLEPPARSAPGRPSTPGRVYWLTGGLGDIGLEVASYLATRTASPRLVLMGRSPFPDKALWSRWVETNGPLDLTSQKISRLQALEKAGAEIWTVSGDVTDLGAMHEIAGHIRKKFGAIHGVFHLAGLPGQGMPSYKHTPDTMSAVLAPKVTGTWVLDQVTRPDSLEHFILFSSLAAVEGGIGMADYSAANAFLDAFAARRWHTQRRKTLSINWTLWEEVGMGTRAAFFGSQRPVPISTHVAIQALHRALTLPESNLIVGRVNGTRGQLPREPGPGSDITTGEAIPPGSTVEARLRAVVADVLETRPERIDGSTPFEEYGMNSRMALELLAKLEAGFNVDLPLTLLADYPTVAQLAEYLKGTPGQP